MFQDALPGLEGQVEAVKVGIALLQSIYHTQTLQVVLKATPAVRRLPECLIEGVLASMSERRVAKVMRQANGLGEFLVQAKTTSDRSCDLGYLQTMRETRTEEITLVVDEDLSLVEQLSKSG
jgi:hypothetical protein